MAFILSPTYIDDRWRIVIFGSKVVKEDIVSTRDYGKLSVRALIVSFSAISLALISGAFFMAVGTNDSSSPAMKVFFAIVLILVLLFGLAAALASIFSIVSICKRQASFNVSVSEVVGVILFIFFLFLVYGFFEIAKSA